MNWQKLIRNTVFQALATLLLATIFSAIWSNGQVNWAEQFRTGISILIAFLIFNYFDARKSQKTGSN